MRSTVTGYSRTFLAWLVLTLMPFEPPNSWNDWRGLTVGPSCLILLCTGQDKRSNRPDSWSAMECSNIASEKHWGRKHWGHNLPWLAQILPVTTSSAIVFYVIVPTKTFAKLKEVAGCGSLPEMIYLPQVRKEVTKFLLTCLGAPDLWVQSAPAELPK